MAAGLVGEGLATTITWVPLVGARVYVKGDPTKFRFVVLVTVTTFAVGAPVVDVTVTREGLGHDPALEVAGERYALEPKTVTVCVHGAHVLVVA